MTLEQKLKESNNELEKREQLAAEVEQRVADRIATSIFATEQKCKRSKSE